MCTIMDFRLTAKCQRLHTRQGDETNDIPSYNRKVKRGVICNILEFNLGFDVIEQYFFFIWFI